MRLLHRPLRAGGAAVLGLATIALTGAFAAGAQASTAAPAAVSPTLVPLSNSLPATTDPQTGAFTASSMSVEVALAPRDEAGLNAELKAVYTKGSGQYGQFLAKGQFDARYAPTTATTGRGRRLPARRGPDGFVHRLAVPDPRHRLEREDHGRLPHRPAQLRGPPGHPLLLQLRLGPPARLDRLRRRGRRRPDEHRAPAVACRPAGHRQGSGQGEPRRGQVDLVVRQLRDRLRDHRRALRPGQQQHQLPVRLRRRPRLQRPDPVADQLHVRGARRQPADRGRRRHRGGLRALRLPGLGHRHLGALLLRAALHPAARERHRGRRPAGPGLPGRRHLPGERQRATRATSRSTPTSRRRWRSRPTSST